MRQARLNGLIDEHGHIVPREMDPDSLWLLIENHIRDIRAGKKCDLRASHLFQHIAWLSNIVAQQENTIQRLTEENIPNTATRRDHVRRTSETSDTQNADEGLLP